MIYVVVQYLVVVEQEVSFQLCGLIEEVIVQGCIQVVVYLVVVGLGRQCKVYLFVDIVVQGGIQGRVDVVGVIQVVIDEAWDLLKGVFNVKVEVGFDG